jgi:hypothetical protein
MKMNVKKKKKIEREKRLVGIEYDMRVADNQISV